MRCQACDAALEENEIIWYPDRQEHESLCRCCRKIVYDLENNYTGLENMLGEGEELSHE